MKLTFKWLGITTAALLVCLEAVSVEARTQQSLKTDSVPNPELLAQKFPRQVLISQRVFRVPIRARRGGIPVIDVTLNDQQTFPMLVDTGASITTITPQMARAIGFRAQGSERVRVGSGEVIEMPRGRISSIRAGEAESNNLTVLVGSTPLLGQNFFSNYNVTLA